MCLRRKDNIAKVPHFVAFVTITVALQLLCIEINFFNIPYAANDMGMMSIGFIVGVIAWKAADCVQDCVYRL